MAAPTEVNVVLALVPSVVMAPMQTTMIRASMTAYSTAVGPSSAFKKSTMEQVKRTSMMGFSFVVRKCQETACNWFSRPMIRRDVAPLLHILRPQRQQRRPRSKGMPIAASCQQPSWACDHFCCDAPQPGCMARTMAMLLFRTGN